MLPSDSAVVVMCSQLLTRESGNSGMSATHYDHDDDVARVNQYCLYDLITYVYMCLVESLRLRFYNLLVSNFCL